MSTPHSEVIPPRRNSRPQLLAGHELSKYAVEERGGISRYANPDRVKNMDPQNRKNRALMRHSPPRIRPRRLDRRTPSLLPLRRFHRIPPETATRPAPEEQRSEERRVGNERTFKTSAKEVHKKHNKYSNENVTENC